MGLLDWLTDGLGGGGDTGSAVSPFITATNNYNGPGGDPVPTPQPDATPPIQSTPPDPSQMGGGSVPLPQPRPPGADAPPLPPPTTVGAPPGGNAPPMMPPVATPAPSGDAALPPGASPTQGTGLTGLQGILQSYRNAGGQFGTPNNQNQTNNGAPQTMLGRAFGLDANRERQIRGSLAEGLKGVAANWNKPGLAAFAGAAGAGLEGGNKADDKTESKQDKYLQRAIEAKKADNTAEYQQNYLKYQIESAKARLENTKESVMNSNEQLYLRGLTAVSQDSKVKASAAALKNLQSSYGPDSPEVKAAMKAHNELIDTTKANVMGTLKVKDWQEIGKKPGFSPQNPVPKAGLTRSKVMALPPGTYYINPSDGRLLIRGNGTPKGAGGAAPPAAQSGAAPLPPPADAAVPATPTSPAEPDDE